MIATDSSRTREFPDVSFDERSNKEDLTETVCPSIMQDIEIDESIRLTEENPEVLSDYESESMDENKDAICNSKHIQDAFVFCPVMGSIQMDSILAQGIFLSEKEMSQMEDRKFSLYNKFTNIIFEEKIPLKVKCKQLKMP